jgi:hypothetical protein
MNIKKTNIIPNTTITDTNASTNTNAKLNIINNNINGVDNVIQRNSILVHSIDNTINIYDNTITGVDNNVTLGENNNKLVNNSGCNNINDNNNNTSVLNKEKTSGEVNFENNIKLLESVDSYPLNLQTEISENTLMLRLRGGVGEEVNKGQNKEETVGERFILTTLDEEESEAIGGRMEDAKLIGMIRLFNCKEKKPKCTSNIIH